MCSLCCATRAIFNLQELEPMSIAAKVCIFQCESRGILATYAR
jgi:hypothetical protein